MTELPGLSSFPSRDQLVQRPRGGWEHGENKPAEVGGGTGQACQSCTRDKETEKLLSSGLISPTAPVQSQPGQLINTLFQIKGKEG